MNVKGMRLDELQSKWEVLRDEVLKKGFATQKEKDDLYAMRREIEKRIGDKKPPVNVNFSDFLTD